MSNSNETINPFIELGERISQMEQGVDLREFLDVQARIKEVFEQELELLLTRIRELVPEETRHFMSERIGTDSDSTKSIEWWIQQLYNRNSQSKSLTGKFYEADLEQMGFDSIEDALAKLSALKEALTEVVVFNFEWADDEKLFKTEWYLSGMNVEAFSYGVKAD